MKLHQSDRDRAYPSFAECIAWIYILAVLGVAIFGDPGSATQGG